MRPRHLLPTVTAMLNHDGVESLLTRIRSEAGAARSLLASASRRELVRGSILPAIGFLLAVFASGNRVNNVAAGVVFAAALLARPVWPALALLAACWLPGPATATLIVVPVLAYNAGYRIGSSRRKVGVLAAATGLAFAAWYFAGIDDAGWQIWAALVGVAVVLLLLLPAAVGAVRAERRRSIDALNERNAVLEQAHRLGNAQARLQERARIAGEMHDLIGHRLSLIALYAGALELRSQRDAPDMNNEATLVRTTAKTALDELRQVLGILRVDGRQRDTEVPDDDAGTRADVAALVEASRRAGLAVELSWSGADLGDVDARARRAVHRVVREALTNAHKHAPDSPTRVRVSRQSAEVLVEITNGAADPAEHHAPGTGMGLIGLQERVELAGGTFEAGQREGRFVVTAVLPVTG